MKLQNDTLSSNIANLLYNKNYLNKSILLTIKHYAQKWNISEFDAILDSHIMTQDELANLISEILQIDRIYNINLENIYSDLFNKIQFEEWYQNISLPYKINNTTIVIMANPFNFEYINKLQNIFPIKFNKAVSTKDVILQTLYNYTLSKAILNK